MIVEIALDHAPQPPPDLGGRLMPASPKLLALQLSGQFCRESLADRLTFDDEPAGLPSLSTHMREPQKVERLRLALPSLLSGFRLQSAQTQSGASCPDVAPIRTLQADAFHSRRNRSRLVSIFESHDDVIGVADHDQVARGTIVAFASAGPIDRNT